MGYGYVGEVDGREGDISSGTGVESEMALSVGHRGAISGVVAVSNERETFRELLGRTEEYGGIYRAIRRPDEAAEMNAGGGRSCGASFVAYVGMDPRMHAAEAREDDGGLFRGFAMPTVGGLDPSRPGRRTEGGFDGGKHFEGGLWAVANREAAARDSREEELRLRGKMLVTTMQRQQLGESAYILQKDDKTAEDQGLNQVQQSEVQKQKDDQGAGAAGASSCKECGNQAKKDCQHQRCRTCCKSRGFDCPTHLKSTWVPVSKRRQRQAEALAEATGQPLPRLKRTRSISAVVPRLPANSTTPTSPGNSAQGSDLNSSHFAKQVHGREKLPSEIRAQAVFKCVRVTGVDDGQDEFAYQCIVKIAGHIFKGVLYDQGIDNGKVGLTTTGFQLAGQSEGPSSTLIDTPVMYGASGTALFEDIGSSKHINNHW